jgi:hypothetical protein
MGSEAAAAESRLGCAAGKFGASAPEKEQLGKSPRPDGMQRESKRKEWIRVGPRIGRYPSVRGPNFDSRPVLGSLAKPKTRKKAADSQ